MGAEYTKAQRNASDKYMAKMHTIRVVVPKEDAEKYKQLAKDKGLSLNKFIIECIEKAVN